MSARILDGKATAARLRSEIGQRTAAFRHNHGIAPGLAVVLVGDDPASHVYVRNKTKASMEAGIASFEHRLPAHTSEAALLDLIRGLNGDSQVHGILVQLPLPPQINAAAVMDTIDPAKDVDGFHVVNTGRLALGLPALTPCTPQGCLTLIKEAVPRLAGKRAVVVGRSNIVGKPMARLLLGENCTVTIAHSATVDLPGECRRADILVAAVGRPQLIRGDWIQPGAVVIDVGINRVDTAGNVKLLGDVCFPEAREVAGAITPVPGGVGPMTIAFLLANTVQAALWAAEARSDHRLSA
jgi:methylenetetrahydrofolate dehydrogenase (NADP+) / methenyltetrahydrofolate cyclohydrolase